jgi:hypothetical protein
MKIRASSFVDGAWTPDVKGTHVPLPLDADAQDAAIFRALERQMPTLWPSLSPDDRDKFADRYRAFITALAAALGEEG